MSDLQNLTDAIIRGDRNEATQLTQAALDAGTEPQGVLDAMVAGMDEIGDRFKKNQAFVPEMLIAARAMKAGLAILRPELVAEDIKPKGKVALGTVKGDLHDIGKNLVAMMLEGAGFEVIDLGIDVAPEQFIEAVNEKGAQVVAMSALLTTTMPSMKTTIDAMKEAGLEGKVKTLIGGAPVTQRYADEVGADGYARDAASGADAAKELLGL